MKKLTWLLVLVLIAFPPAGSLAELSAERAAFYQSRTDEWEAALGPYHLWNYHQRALFGSIYHRLPGDYFSPELPARIGLPTLPPEDVLPFDHALHIAEAFLYGYDQRITDDYLDQLHLSSAYYDFRGDAKSTITSSVHAQCWFFQFWDMIEAGNHIARCTVYLDAATGRICCLELGLDMTHAEDWKHYEVIRFP